MGRSIPPRSAFPRFTISFAFSSFGNHFLLPLLCLRICIRLCRLSPLPFCVAEIRLSSVCAQFKLCLKCEEEQWRKPTWTSWNGWRANSFRRRKTKIFTMATLMCLRRLMILLTAKSQMNCMDVKTPWVEESVQKIHQDSHVVAQVLDLAWSPADHF